MAKQFMVIFTDSGETLFSQRDGKPKEWPTFEAALGYVKTISPSRNPRVAVCYTLDDAPWDENMASG